MTIFDSLREWGERYSRAGRFSPVGVTFHWVMAALVIFQLGVGVAMTLLVPAGGDKLRWYEVHSSVGLVVLVLAFGRIAWRALVRSPFNDADMMGWRTFLAYAVERTFYLCFFLLPISGWVMWSAVAPQGPLEVAGILPWPQFPLDTLPATLRWQIMGFAENVHLILVWVLLLLVPLHVAAALKHHFWDRNDVLRGMLPEIPDHPDPHLTARRKPRGRRSRQGSAAG